MTFPYKVCVETIIDLEDLIDKWNNDKQLINYMISILGSTEYNLVNFIVNEGFHDLLGQKPADDGPIEDDPYAKPNPDFPLEPPIYNDDDPYGKPIGWDPANGVFYDKESGCLVDKEGSVLWKPGDPPYGQEQPEQPENPEESENPYLQDWKNFLTEKHPEDSEAEFPQSEEDSPYWDEFMEYMATIHNLDEGIAGTTLSTPTLL